MDKLYFRSLTDPSVAVGRDDLAITVGFSADERTVTVSDNGIGMTKDELDKNLGTIAHSDSFEFKAAQAEAAAESEPGEAKGLDDLTDVDIIGQFGVGFYSAFMVADKVTVISKAYGADEAWQWESSGADGYELEPAEKETAGTDIILHIKPDTETDNYDNFLDEYGIVAIVKKYSDYVRYPIQMEREKSRQKPEPDPKPEDYKPEWETYTELETLNSMVPIWKKQKSEVTDEEYASFYKDKFNDYSDPARVIVSRTEGTANYNALLFVPSHRPYDFYTKDYEKGLALYASGVLIMEKCADLLPDYFSFVKGIVDSQDLSLNISREMLQKDSQLKLIHNALEKKIKNELHAMLANDREKYESFWKEFGRQLKFGAYSDYGMHAELLRDLLLFWSAKEQKMVTIQEYIDNNKVDMNKTYNSTFFNFVDYRLGTTRDLSNSIDSAYSDKYGPVVGDGEYVEIVHSQSYKTRFIYDESANEYKMQQNYSDGQWRDTVDEAADNKVLTFPNVIVLYTDIHTYPGHEAKDLQYVEYAWGGIGYYCYGGKCEKIYWQKGTPLEALRLYYLNEDGTCSDTPLEVNIGKSYVCLLYTSDAADD